MIGRGSVLPALSSPLHRKPVARAVAVTLAVLLAFAALIICTVVGGLGYCGLDKKRAPLTGDEQRSCWTGAIDAASDGVFAALSDLAEATRPQDPQPRGDVRPVSGR